MSAANLLARWSTPKRSNQGLLGLASLALTAAALDTSWTVDEGRFGLCSEERRLDSTTGGDGQRRREVESEDRVGL